MKKGILKVIGIAIIGAIVLSNCSQKPKIGLLMDEAEEGRWVKDKEMFIQQIEKLGGDAMVRAAQGDADLQMEQAIDLLHKKIDVLVIIPVDLNAAAEIVRLAHKYDVKVISYDRIVKNCNLDFYLSFDDVKIGELQAQYLATACPKGKYAIIGGAITDNNTFLLRLGQLNVLQPLIYRGDIEIVYDKYVDVWSEEEGYRLMKECLGKTKDIQAVLAANDQLAGGAIKAIEEAGIETKICISGQDAELEACRRIMAGKQSMSIYLPLEALAAQTAQTAIHMATRDEIPHTLLTVNNGAKQVPSILLEAMVVNQETIDLTVIADGYFEDHQVFK